MSGLVVSETNSTINVSNRERIPSQSPKYIMNVTGLEAIGLGVVTPINISVTLIESVDPVTGVNVTMEIPKLEQVGMYFAEGNASEYTRTMVLGDFSPGETKLTSLLINSTGEKTFMLVKTYLYEEGVQQYITYYSRDDKDWRDGWYAVFGIELTKPYLKFEGPLETREQVVPRLRLIENEEATLTYRISNTGDPVINLVIWYTSPDTLQILDINATNVPVLENNTVLTIVIKGKCTVNYASLKRFHIFINADNIALRERVVKVQTYDWFNPFKFDNEIVIITWPLMLGLMTVLTVLFIRFYWKKHKERVRITKELEERYGSALDIPE